MKNFKSISEWLKSNPSKEEQDKIMILINRGATSKTRRELWEKEQYLRKLQSLINHFKKLNLEPPKEQIELVANTKRMIEEIKKELPPVQKRETKEKEVLAGSSEK